MLLCALCLRDPWTGPRGRVLLGEDLPRYPGSPYEPEAITIANGQALCETHFRRLVDWQSEVHGPLSIEALLRVMHAPGPVPAPPWDDAPRPKP